MVPYFYFPHLESERDQDTDLIAIVIAPSAPPLPPHPLPPLPILPVYDFIFVLSHIMVGGRLPR